MTARSGATNAFLLLTADHVRRLLREGIVLRSLIFPGALVVVAMVGTVIAVTGFRPADKAAIPPALAEPAFVAALEAEGFEALVTLDPRAAVADEEAAAGTDGTTLFVGPHPPPPSLEALLRERLGATWKPFHMQAMRSKSIQSTDSTRYPAIFIGALFALYGVVFGAGGVARDRDEGTLDAELSTAVPHVIHGLARWLAGTLVLTGFYGMSVYGLHAVVGVPGVSGIVLHGAAAAATATAIGLLVVGGSGLDRGFAGPMSAGLVGVFSLLSMGVGGKQAGAVLPIASMLVRDASPLPPLGLALVAGLLAAVSFARRTAVS